MNKLSLLSMACAVLSISACDHYSDRLAALDSSSDNIAAISPAAGGEMTFGQYLQSEYYHLAKYEQNEAFDYKAAKYYTKKAAALSKGHLVAPAAIKEFAVKPSRSAELSRAREELIAALQTYNIPENRYTLAMAQTRYDCWLDQQEEQVKDDDVLTCKNEFRHAMESLVPPDGTAVKFPIAFDSGSMVLSEEARITLGRALAFWCTNQHRGYQLGLYPAKDIPAAEAERQNAMMRGILQFNGVPPSEIVSGETRSENESFEVRLTKEPATVNSQEAI